METIVADYSEMPGLALTVAQACRLWNCDVESLRRVADVLVAHHVLCWSRDGRLIQER